MSVSFSLGRFQLVFRRTDSVPKPLIDEAKLGLRQNSGGYDAVPEHPNHARLAEASKSFVEVAEQNAADMQARLAAQQAAQAKHGERILQVLNDSDAVDLVELLENQLKAAHPNGSVGNPAIRLGRDMVPEDFRPKGDLYLFRDTNPRTFDSHFQDQSRVVVGVRHQWSLSLRQVHLTEVEGIDPDKLRARLDAITERAIAAGRIADEDRTV